MRAFENGVLDLFASHLGPRLDALRAELDRCERERDWHGAIEAGSELLGFTGGEELDEFEVMVSMRLASALFAADGEGRGARVERSIQLLQRVIDILDAKPSLDERSVRAQALTNLGAAYGARLRGDYLANQDRAIGCLRSALEFMTLGEDGRAWAMAQTNLGLALLQRAAERMNVPTAPRGNTEDESEHAANEIEEAIECFTGALRWRTFERDPMDWAYTQINLGLAFSRRRVGRRKENEKEAVKRYQLSAEGFAAARQPELFANALHNLSSARLVLARLHRVRRRHKAKLLDQAARDSYAALEANPLSSSPIEAGRRGFS